MTSQTVVHNDKLQPAAIDPRLQPIACYVVWAVQPLAGNAGVEGIPEVATHS